jgi:hemerythrin
MKWDNTYGVGIDVIDRQHRQLVEHISGLEQALRSGNRAGVGDVIERVIGYTVSHFAFEEALMERAHYAVLAQHKRVHDDFTRRMHDYQRRFQEGEDVGRKLLSELRGWITNHEQRDDRDYVPVVRRTLEEGWMSKTVRRIFG